MGVFFIDNANKTNVKKNDTDWNLYYSNVYSDYKEMKDEYPFCYLTILPTVKPSCAEIWVVAVNKRIIEAVNGEKNDFLGEYSKELHIIIPEDYRENGCYVYGARWVKTDKLFNKDIHFLYDDETLNKKDYGRKMCVGTPESFPLMKNVILENVKTAENMLIAYERVMTGLSNELELIAYAHGNKGREQFCKNINRYIPKR